MNGITNPRCNQRNNMARENHWHVPGKTVVQKQHISDHDTLQMLQRHALDKAWKKFDTLLLSLPSSKHDAIKELCRYPNAKKNHCDSYYEGRTMKYYTWGVR